LGVEREGRTQAHNELVPMQRQGLQRYPKIRNKRKEGSQTMTEQKKIPSPVLRWIFLVGSVFGLLFAGVSFLLLPRLHACIVWLVVVFFALGWAYITDWRNRDLLEEWGITGKKKENKQ